MTSRRRARTLVADLSRRMDDFERSAYWNATPGEAPQADKANRDQLRALGYTAK